MKALLSIKPEYVDKIISGDKRFEYRKRIFKKDVKSVVVYSTQPVGKIMGEFTIEEILADEPSELWNQTSEFSGISKDLFMDYFNNKHLGFALKIKEFIAYKQPLDPYDIFENFVAPQSYMYIDDDFLLK